MDRRQLNPQLYSIVRGAAGGSLANERYVWYELQRRSASPPQAHTRSTNPSTHSPAHCLSNTGIGRVNVAWARLRPPSPSPPPCSRSVYCREGGPASPSIGCVEVCRFQSVFSPRHDADLRQGEPHSASLRAATAGGCSATSPLTSLELGVTRLLLPCCRPSLARPSR